MFTSGGHPFSAPAFSPERTYFCDARKIRIIGKTTIIAARMASCNPMGMFEAVRGLIAPVELSNAVNPTGKFSFESSEIRTKARK